MLGMPKSTVSRQIRALEVRLGTRLLERTTRQLVLTQIGEIFLAHCERVISEAEDAERVVAAHTATPRGLLRVGVPITFARIFLAPVVAQFCRKYPEIRIDLLLRGDRVDPVKMLLDLVIDVGRRDDSSYATRKLGSIPQGLFASRDYLNARPQPQSPADLDAHDIIAMGRSRGSSHWNLTAPSGQQKEVRIDPRIAVNDPVIAHRFATSGLGIALLPDFLTRNDGTLVRILPEWRVPPVEFFAVYPDRRLIPPKLRAFLDELQENLSLQS
jgi:hypothetical protein